MALVQTSSYGAAPLTGKGVAPPPPPDAVPANTNVVGTLLVLVADAMVLGTLLAVWWVIKAGSPSWPPPGVRVNTYIPSVVAITAAMSAISMQWMVSSIRRNDQRSAGAALGLTLVFGVSIVTVQWYYLDTIGFGTAEHAYGTMFHLLIGYHLLHMAIAVGALVVVGSRAMAGHFGRFGYDPLKAVSALWQYSNVAWLAILSALFLFSALS